MTHIQDANNKPLIDIERLSVALEQFAADRDWHQFHSPKNLVMALTGEVGELTEIFQWMTEEQSRTACSDAKTAQQIRDELADVMLYLVRLSSVIVAFPQVSRQIMMSKLKWSHANATNEICRRVQVRGGQTSHR